jgi:hypothetical protein
MPTEEQIKAAVCALGNLASIGRGIRFEDHELREAAHAVLTAAERVSHSNWDVPTIQREHFACWIGRKLWAIVEMPNGNFQVYEQSEDGVAPQSEYPTKRKAVARFMQLMRVGPVAPQTWPEEICIGRVER